MLEVRGGKPVKLAVKGEAVLPAVDIQQEALDFGEVYTGVTARIPLTIINTTPVLAGMLSALLVRHPSHGYQTQDSVLLLVLRSSRPSWGGWDQFARQVLTKPMCPCCLLV